MGYVILLILLYVIVALVVIGVLYYFRPFQVEYSLNDEGVTYVLIGCFFPIALFLYILLKILEIPFTVVDIIKEKQDAIRKHDSK